MLVQFSVENFLSFDEETIFSMVATSGDQHPEHLIPEVPSKGESLLRGAAIYGANGAGKSNLVQAIRFAQKLIVQGTRGTQSIAVRPYKLAVTSDKRPSKFDFVIKTQGVLYNYGFLLNNNVILEEWLYATHTSKEALYFKRIATKENEVEVVTGQMLKGKTKKQGTFLEFVAKGTRPNQLFLTEALEKNIILVKPVIEWFQNVLLVISAEQTYLDLEFQAHKSADFTEYMGNFLRAAGTGIENVTTEEVIFDVDRYLLGVPENLKEDIREEVSSLEPNQIMGIRLPGHENFIVRKGTQNQPMLVRLRMEHSMKDGRLVPFQIDEESEGTQRLIHLIPTSYSLREKAEKVIVIDELDRRLHTMLSRMFIQTALDCDNEHKQSQLIFTTHDTNLLDLDLLRRDEIWFAEKDRGGASHLYSLAEFKVRHDLKIEKGYLNGRFGAIPFLGDIRCMGLSESSGAAAEKESQQHTKVVHAA